ncbi:Major tail protein [Glutamicibacter phage Voltaire]|uniref:Major tail protein n=1 Tax=Glutamicibacter phage Voltaire TaxID=2891955 RepID=UPI00204A77E2|nr:Major tail protein [Glutamicibacter phage Voltaire]CAH1191497.1 Major tail protein [Glutamicibacter phage Voltaire]
MSNEIDSLPRDRTFGKAFDYKRYKDHFTKASFHRVPWDQSYKDIVHFNTTAELDAYLDFGDKRQFDDLSYLKMGEPITINLPFNQVIEWNYVRVQNFSQPVVEAAPDKLMSYYYFITDVQYVSANATRVILQLDAWQTYGRTITFGDAYVTQGHVGIAEETALPNEDGLLSTPEGLNLGGDYRVGATNQRFLAPNTNAVICVVSASDLTGDYGTIDDPKLRTAGGSLFEGLPNGGSIYLFKQPSDFKAYMNATKDQSWVTQAIISVTALPMSWADMTSNGLSYTDVTLNGVNAATPDDFTKVPVTEIDAGVRADMSMNWVDSRYSHLKKFSMFPYMFFELNTYTGEPLTMKNEMFSSSSPNVKLKVYLHAAPPAPRLAMMPVGYGTTTGTNGEHFNVAQWISNFPQFSVVNNGSAMVLASQAHSLSQSYKSADWAQQRAMAGANTSYDQATAASGLTANQANLGIGAANAQTALQNSTITTKAVKDAAFGIGGGILSGARGGGVGMAAGALTGAIGAASTGIDAAISINQNTQSTNIATNLTANQAQNTIGNMDYNRDTNFSLAQFGAKGDYQNAVAQINAKVEDAKLSQPSTAGTTGGDAFMLAVEGWSVHVKTKHIPKSAMRAIGDYWLRYGYAINRFVNLPQDLQVMEYFTYWKCSEVYIIDARCPEPIKRIISGILEKGVTVHRHPNTISQGFLVTMVNPPIIGKYVR